MKKNLIIVIATSFFAAPVLAQSTTVNVPENRITPSYDVPAAKQVVIQPARVQQPVVIIDKNSSLYQAPVKAAVPAQKVDQTGSLAPNTPAKTPAKNADIDGSIAPPVKKVEAKPVAAPAGAQSING